MCQCCRVHIMVCAGSGFPEFHRKGLLSLPTPPAYSPVLSPCDFFLLSFPLLKKKKALGASLCPSTLSGAIFQCLQSANKCLLFCIWRLDITKDSETTKITVLSKENTLKYWSKKNNILSNVFFLDALWQKGSLISLAMAEDVVLLSRTIEHLNDRKSLIVVWYMYTLLECRRLFCFVFSEEFSCMYENNLASVRAELSFVFCCQRFLSFVEKLQEWPRSSEKMFWLPQY